MYDAKSGQQPKMSSQPEIAEAPLLKDDGQASHKVNLTIHEVQ